MLGGRGAELGRGEAPETRGGWVGRLGGGRKKHIWKITLREQAVHNIWRRWLGILWEHHCTNDTEDRLTGGFKIDNPEQTI